MAFPDTEFYRSDPITGCFNYLSFVENLDRLLMEEPRKPFSILYLDVNFMESLNEIKGFAYGDSILRWLGIVLTEACNCPAYRISGDDFAVILTEGEPAEREELLSQIFARLNAEGEQIGIPTPPASIALIHFDAGDDISINDILFHLGETVRIVKKEKNRAISVFQARDLLKSSATPEEQDPERLRRSWEILNFIANRFIDQVRYMGQELDAAQLTSYQDTISDLPNLRAALRKLDRAVHEAAVTDRPFSILLTDGDNFRQYNNINFLTGDEIIHKTGLALSENLRPGDFLARWRTGDEFIIILPSTTVEGARIAAERFRKSISTASAEWVLPSSISIGIAAYPLHGGTARVLVEAAEAALKRAKAEGKDRVVLAE